MIKKFIPLIFLSIFIITGCSHLGLKKDKQQNPMPQEAYSNKEQKSTSYDFPDVPIPAELKLDVKDSLVFESKTLKAGVLVYKGRVDALSLFEFFTTQLPNNGWQLRSYFKYGKFIVLFSKPDKDLVIRIVDKGFITELFIWIVPRSDDSQELIKPTLNEEVIKP